MGRALNKLFTFILAAGLVFSGPVCPHARASMSGGVAQHESAAVAHYADLAIDPGDEECPISRVLLRILPITTGSARSAARLA